MKTQSSVVQLLIMALVVALCGEYCEAFTTNSIWNGRLASPVMTSSRSISSNLVTHHHSKVIRRSTMENQVDSEMHQLSDDEIMTMISSDDSSSALQEQSWLAHQSDSSSSTITAANNSNTNDSILNNSVFLGMVASLVFFKLFHTNMDFNWWMPMDFNWMRGWTAQEIAMRMPLEWYQAYYHTLVNAPIATKAVTSATVYTIGDLISQLQSEEKSLDELDVGRTVRSLLAGLIGHGPLSHFWYILSDDVFTNMLHVTAWWSFIPKVAVDQMVWGPIWNNTYILIVGLLQRDSFSTMWSSMKRNTVPLVTQGLKLWVPAHCITYGLVPIENRLLWVDLVEIAWVTILSSQAAGADDVENDAEPATQETSHDIVTATTTTTTATS